MNPPENPWREYALALQDLLDYHARVKCMDCVDDEYGRIKDRVMAARRHLGFMDWIETAKRV